MGDDRLLHYLDWDSEFFGLRIGQTTVNQLTLAEMVRLDSSCTQQDIDCLYLLVDAADGETFRLAEDSGFHLVDIRVTLDCRLPALEGSPWQAAHPFIRLASAGDALALRPIAAVNHRDSRFYQDGNFPRERCDELYATWIEKSCNGYADAVLVADRGEGAIGYASCHIKENGVGNIGLVGISNQCQGQGLGKLLISEALRWFAANGVREVEVVTQGKNIGAQRLYQKCGFMTEAMQLWFHKWLKASPKSMHPVMSTLENQ